MSYRERAEKELVNKISAKLSKNGGGWVRSWLNPEHYPQVLLLDNSLQLDPIKKHKVILQFHSYEIFEYKKPEMEKYIETACKKLEESMIEVFLERDLSKRIAYAEGVLSLSLEYRISILTLNYNIAEW